MEFSYAAKSETGHVRAANEDQYWADPNLGLFVVCDGMGGHKGGRRASELACEVIRDTLADLTPLADRVTSRIGDFDSGLFGQRVEEAILAAHRQICQEADSNSALAGMGTTCTLFLATKPGEGIIGHVGDSRLYVLEEGVVDQLTEDHSLVNELVKNGTIKLDGNPGILEQLKKILVQFELGFEIMPGTKKVSEKPDRMPFEQAEPPLSGGE